MTEKTNPRFPAEVYKRCADLLDIAMGRLLRDDQGEAMTIISSVMDFLNEEYGKWPDKADLADEVDRAAAEMRKGAH